MRRLTRHLVGCLSILGIVAMSTVISAAPAHAAGPMAFPQVANNLDGRLELFAMGSVGGAQTIEHQWQTNTSPTGWSEWASLGRPPVSGEIYKPSVGRHQDGRLDVFVMTKEGGAYHNFQVAPGSAWAGWFGLGDYQRPGSGVSPLHVASNQDGTLQIFATDNIDLWTQKQTTPNGLGWSGWVNLGHPGVAFAAGTPSAVLDAGGRLTVLVGDGNGGLHLIKQVTPGGAWSAWSIPTTLSGFIPGKIKNATLIKNTDGRLEAFATNETVVPFSGEVWHGWETTPGGPWSSWALLQPTEEMATRGSLAAVQNLDGRVQAFAMTVGAYDDAGALVSFAQDSPGGSMSGRGHIGGSNYHQGFTVDGGIVHHAYQLTAGGTWSGMTPLVGAAPLAPPAKPTTDFNGDGRSDFAVFRPSGGYWGVTYTSGGSANALSQWGGVGDIPIPGDYNGDSETDFAVFRPSVGYWAIAYTGGSLTAPVTSTANALGQWGGVGDIPVPGDYNGDGKTDFAVFRPSIGYWAIAYTGGSLTNPVTSTANAINYFGTFGDIPIPGDYNGDHKTDFAYFRPSAGRWAIAYTGGSLTNPVTGTNDNVLSPWGGIGDIPLGATAMDRYNLATPAVPAPTYTITAQHSGQCLDVVDASTANGARIQQWQCNGSSQQKWDLVPATGGTYLLRNRHSGKCLDVYNANAADGTPFQQWDCNSVTQQQFTVPTPGTWGTIGVYGKCLDITAGSNTMGARLQLWTCLGNLNQSYKLTQTS